MARRRGCRGLWTCPSSDASITVFCSVTSCRSARRASTLPTRAWRIILLGRGGHRRPGETGKGATQTYPTAPPCCSPPGAEPPPSLFMQPRQARSVFTCDRMRAAVEPADRPVHSQWLRHHPRRAPSGSMGTAQSSAAAAAAALATTSRGCWRRVCSRGRT